MPIYIGGVAVDMIAGTKTLLDGISLQEKVASPTETEQVITADSNYDALGKVIVEPISSTYIGSSITKKSAATYTPNDNTQIISSGVFLSGNQTISPVPTQEKSVTSNGTYTPDAGKYLSKVVVNVPSSGGSAALGEKTITENGTYKASDDSLDGYSSVNVNVPAPVINLQSKLVTPSEISQTVTADETYDALEKVTVNAIPSTYLGSSISRKDSQTYTPGSSQQIISAGQYLNGDQIISPVSTETKYITTNGVYSPSEGNYFESVTVSVSPTLQSKSIIPTESQQNVTADDNYDGLSNVTVDAISSSYIGSSIKRKTAETYTPGDSIQKISAGQYLEGDQTISAVQTETRNVTSNGTYTASTGKYISSFTVSVPDPNMQSKTVTPTESQQIISADSGYDGLQEVIVNAIPSSYIGSAVVFQTYYTGSSTPSSSLGNDGDIYIKV